VSCGHASRASKALARCKASSARIGSTGYGADASRETAASWTQASYGVVCRFEQEADRAR